MVPFEDLVCLIPASLLSEGLISELEGMAQDRSDSTLYATSDQHIGLPRPEKDIVGNGWITVIVFNMQDVHIAQQKAETKQRALAIEDEEGDEEKQPKRRVLCRSTHDKTKQECWKNFDVRGRA